MFVDKKSQSTLETAQKYTVISLLVVILWYRRDHPESDRQLFTEAVKFQFQ